MKYKPAVILVFAVGMLSQALLLNGCADHSLQYNYPDLRAEGNPLSKEGQIARIRLQIQVADLKELANAPTDVNGLLQANGASFHVSSLDGQERVQGQVEENSLLLPTAQLGAGPYLIEITLPTGQVLQAKIQDTLNAGETRVFTAENVTVRSNEQNCGDNCTQIAGDVKIEQRDLNVDGQNCVGVNVTCSDTSKRN